MRSWSSISITCRRLWKSTTVQLTRLHASPRLTYLARSSSSSFLMSSTDKSRNEIRSGIVNFEDIILNRIADEIKSSDKAIISHVTLNNSFIVSFDCLISLIYILYLSFFMNVQYYYKINS
jgi:hypothetical protein